MRIHRHLPVLRRIYASRDQARERLAIMTALRASAVAELKTALTERDAAIGDRDRAFSARDEAILERDNLLSAREALMAQAAVLRRKDYLVSSETVWQHHENGILKYRTRPFIVVMAVARSGSTLLQGVLNAMPGCLVRGENGGFLLPLARAYAALCFAKNHSSSFTTPASAWFGCEELDPDSLLASFACQTIRQLLGAGKSGEPVAIGFKEIRWLQSELGSVSLWSYLGFIERLFPDTRFVLLTRNVDELLQSGWWPVVATAATRLAIEEFYALARMAPVRSRFELDYSELHEDSDKIRRLAEFVGSQYTPDINPVFAARHSYDTSESNLREREIARLRAMLQASAVST